MAVPADQQPEREEMETDHITAIVKELDARRQIQEAMVSYARGVDRCDPDLIRAAFHPDGWDDHGSFAGPVEGFIDWVMKLHLEGFTWTSHEITNSHIEFSGDTARGETYVIATLRFEQEGETFDLVGHGRYLDLFEERDGRWKILKRRAVVDATRTEPVRDYAEHATDMQGGGDTLVDELTTGTRDANDPSYAHFHEEVGA